MLIATKEVMKAPVRIISEVPGAYAMLQTGPSFEGCFVVERIGVKKRYMLVPYVLGQEVQVYENYTCRSFGSLIDATEYLLQ